MGASHPCRLGAPILRLVPNALVGRAQREQPAEGRLRGIAGASAPARGRLRRTAPKATPAAIARGSACLRISAPGPAGAYGGSRRLPAIIFAMALDMPRSMLFAAFRFAFMSRSIAVWPPCMAANFASLSPPPAAASSLPYRLRMLASR